MASKASPTILSRPSWEVTSWAADLSFYTPDFVSIRAGLRKTEDRNAKFSITFPPPYLKVKGKQLKKKKKKSPFPLTNSIS